MLDCLTLDAAASRPAQVTTVSEWPAWRDERSPAERRWLEGTGFRPEAGKVALLPGPDGVRAAVLVVGEPATLWDAAALVAALPAGDWRLDDPTGLVPDPALGFALASYRFTRFKADERPQPRLVVREGAALHRAETLARAVWQARDLINLPAGDLGPDELEDAVGGVAAAAGVAMRVVRGDELLRDGYPAIHAVGRASTRAPRLLDLVWGEATAPKLTLVGKGVCFDTGGLDIKPASGMAMMKKDMGGAALMLALARSVIGLGLPVRLRLLIPAVENSIAGNAFRPGDVIRMRSGTTVEIGNTDAEGRLILADALTDADGEAPALMLDAATLTGAARVALGPELPAMFTPDEALASDLMAASAATGDPVWRLPLFQPYRSYIKSKIADINNAGSKPLAGAITAALFLQSFVKQTPAWAHLDVFAWNDEARPGRPQGGEATAFRALLALIERRFAG